MLNIKQTNFKVGKGNNNHSILRKFTIPDEDIKVVSSLKLKSDNSENQTKKLKISDIHQSST